MKCSAGASLFFSAAPPARRWLALHCLFQRAHAPLQCPMRRLLVLPPRSTLRAGPMRLLIREMHTSNQSFLDEDFVDMDASTEPSELEVKQTHCASIAGASAVTPPLAPLSTCVESCCVEADEAILGVVSLPPEKAGTEYSRFHLPVEKPRRGKALPRQNTRSMASSDETSKVSEEEASAGTEGRHFAPSGSAVQDAAKESTTSQASDHPLKLSESSLELAGSSAPLKKKSSSSDDMYTHGRMPEPSSLPYDDEAFAEMLLQMEVDGAIDEVWQDAKKAYVEDVKELCEILGSLKVRDICCIDVSDKTGSFDYIICGTCEGPRHIHIAAWAAQEADSLHRVSKVSRKKTDELWEVVPIGRILLNLMVESLREELALERKWAITRTMDPLQAANAPVSEGRHAKAHGLWTLTLNLQDLEDFEVDYCKDVLLSQA